MRNFFVSFVEIFEVALIAVGAVFLIRSFLIQPFLVSGSSMVPNFSDGDYLLIDELTYRFREPRRGEVVVFRSPENFSTFFIKRIIGLPGEKVDIENGKIFIVEKNKTEKFLLEESYILSNVLTKGGVGLGLGGEEYFLLGDNRSYSFDSRSWGPLRRENIIGLVRLRLWPVSDFQAFAAPAY